MFAALPVIAQQAPQPPVPASAPIAVAQAPAPNYAGFVATPATELGPEWGQSPEELRKSSDYLALTKNLRVARSENILARDYVRALRADSESLRASDKFQDAAGIRVLQILNAHIAHSAESVERLIAEGQPADLPLSGALASPSFFDELWMAQAAPDVPGAPSAGPGPHWEIRSYLDGSALRVLPYVDAIPSAASSARLIPTLAKLETEDGSQLFATYLSAEQYFGLRAFCDAAQFTREAVIPMAAIAASLELNAQAWRNYLQRGYPQFPWENLINDRLVSSAWNRPPDHQFVVLHPTLGVLLDLGSAKDANLEPALLVHVFGLVSYLDDERAWYLGGSATLGVSSDEDLGLAYGLTLHGGNASEESLMPQVDLGLLWHESRDEDGWLVSVGVDVARWLGR